MSAADANRFIADLAKDKNLAERLKPHAAGLTALAAGARTHGYDFTADELKQAMRDKTQRNLNDAQLDAIAGGQQVTTANSTAASNTVIMTTIDVFISINANTIVEVGATSAVATLVV